MSVTAYVQTLEVESMTTGIHGMTVDDTLCHKRKTLSGLECRARRILSHNGTV
jgi:hypothetical protein